MSARRPRQFTADVAQAVEEYRKAIRLLLAADDAVRAAKCGGIATAIARAECAAADARTAVTEARLTLDQALTEDGG